MQLFINTKWLNFEVKGHDHDETKYGQRSTLGILQVLHLNVSVTDNLSIEGMMVDGLPLRTM